MQWTVRQIAEMIGGEIEGNPDAVIKGPSKIDDSFPDTITFLANPKYEPHLYPTKAAAVIVPKDFQPKYPVQTTFIRVADVYSSLAMLFARFSRKAPGQSTISERAFVHPGASLASNVGVGHFSVIEKGARIGAGTSIASQVYIGENVVIGENVTLFPGVKIYHDSEIGNNCILHANVVIGSDGFGFAPAEDGTYQKIHQLGIVIIEDDVEIGANTTIDRGSIGPTVIRQGVKLDNLIQVAHNVEIGKNSVIAAQTGIAGSAKLGENLRVGGHVAIVGHIHVADGAQIQGKTGVASNIKEPGSKWWGTPAIPYMDYVRAYIKFKQLPDLDARLRAIEKKFDQK